MLEKDVLDKLARTIGAAAKSARKKHGLTQEDAAERVGVSVEFYARIERGHALPSVGVFTCIANALGVSADVLIGRNGVSNSAELPSWQPNPPVSDTPEVRRLLRLARRASSKALGLATQVLKAFDKQKD